MWLWIIGAVVALFLAWFFGVYMAGVWKLEAELGPRLKVNKIDEELRSRLKVDERYVVEAISDPEHFGLVGNVLSKAMYTDPVVEYLFEDKRAERATYLYTGMSKLSSLMVLRSGKKENVNWLPVMTIRDTQENNTVVGGAIWLAPNCVPEVPDYMIFLKYYSLIFKWGFSTFKRVFGFGLVMEEAHEKHMGTRRHWYLAVIGVDPEYQGRGLGTRLMQPIMILADEQKTEIYLECSKESNVSYYERHNFEVLGIMRPKGGPPSWVMRRLPQPIN